MKSLRFTSFGMLLLLLLLSQGSPVSAESSSSAPGASACSDTVNKELAKEQRLYRSVLLGHPKAEAASVGDVRFDREGDAWIKTEKTKWKSAAKGFEGITWSDSQMDQQDEQNTQGRFEERRGIFETKRVLTSDLVPYLTQSFRALQCRIDLICRTVDLSVMQQKKEAKRVNVGAAGCIEEERDTYPSCHLAQEKSDQVQGSDAFAYCTDAGKGLLDREEDLLRMLVEYDAAYRSLLQLAGNMDLFLGSFEWPVNQLLRQTAGILGYMQRIPCFIATCDPQPLSSSSSARP